MSLLVRRPAGDQSVGHFRWPIKVDYVNIDGVEASRLLTITEVARRLGVKRETVYAYVSRGLLERDPSSARHRSLFDADLVERLAASARSTDRSRAVDVVVETQITEIDPAGRLSYRGRDATELARFCSLEEVATILWGGDALAPWELDETSRSALVAVCAAVPETTPPSDLIPLAIAALATTDGRRDDRRPAAVRRAGARICAGVLDVLACRQEARDRTAAARLGAALCRDDRAPRQAQLAALNAALVLLADHELAASTFATRVAASAWADPYRAVLAGLGPLGGALHGGSPRTTQSFLASIAQPSEAAAALERAREDGYVPGFGHRVYVDRDPRGDDLLGRIPTVAGTATQARTVAAVLDAAAALGLPAPNVDFGLAALAYVMDLKPDAATTIFTFARLVGLVAHAMEEYPHRLRFRPRATYRGSP